MSKITSWTFIVPEKTIHQKVPDAPVKPNIKQEYDNLDTIAKNLFPEPETKNIKCQTDGCKIEFNSVNDEIRCDDCRKYNTGLITKCSYPECNDVSKMSHNQIKYGQEKYGAKFRPFDKCITHSKSSEFTIVWAYDTKCSEEECKKHVQLNQSKLDFFKQPGMRIPKFCYDCVQKRKISKEKEVDCPCASCGDIVKMSEMQKISIEKSDHLISCEKCRTTMTKKCVKCKKDFLSKARVTELQKKLKDKYRDDPCCSMECFKK